MDVKTAANLSLAGRTAFGVVSYISPDLAWRPFGVRVPAGKSQRYMGRMFAGRDIALGLIGLLSKGKARKTALTCLVMNDVLDAGAAITAHKQGDHGTIPTAALLVGGGCFMGPELAELLMGGKDED